MSDIPAYDAQNDKSILVSQNVGYERSRKVRMNSAPSSRKNIILLLIILLSFFPNLFYFITRLPLNLLNHWGPTNPTSSAQPSPAPAPPPPNMSWAQKTITLPRKSRGCYLITDQVQQELPEIRDYKVGLLHLFIQHTSCALSINENWDKDVQVDMNDALNRLVPENGRMYRHSAEGSDDMPVRSPMVSARNGCFIRANGRIGYD